MRQTFRVPDDANHIRALTPRGICPVLTGLWRMRHVVAWGFRLIADLNVTTTMA